jgi:outer membrane protein assembly factor BamA
VALGQPSIEQTGELAIEANLEERFKITGVFEGAVFVDMGNIWMITNDERSRPGSQLQANTFYQEIAIGSGFGLRLNFSFFILRLDAAFRVYDPLQPEGKRIVVRDASLRRPFGQSQGFPLMNLGIGYPF